MASSRWEHVFELFDAALARPSAERDAFLTSQASASGDTQLREDVESLLAAHHAADGFLSVSVLPSGLLSGAALEAAAARILSPGTRVGVFEIETFAGAGGMGEVYRARDTRLDRRVALKVLSAEGATDPRHRARFAYEALAIARLSHPHICALYDLGHHEGVDFLVMEYLYGETLAARLRRGPLTLDEAVRIGIEIASALEAAHAEGVVHSDLKPSNVMLVTSGSGDHAPHAKLLDFGLARFQRALPVSAESEMPGAGLLEANGGGSGVLIAGTPRYMAPEQLLGAESDPRSDLFSLGCVLNEMVSGRGSRRLEKVIQRCLENTPERRYGYVRDVRLELEAIARAATPGRARLSTWRWIAVVGGLSVLASLAAIAAIFVYQRDRTGRASAVPPPAAMKVAQLTALNGLETAATFSPDGTRVAFSWNGEREDNYDIYVQTIGSSEVRRLTTDRAVDSLPAWSPDGQQIAFLREHPVIGNVIYAVRPDGSDERKLADFRIGEGSSARIAWTPDSRAIVGRPDVSEERAKANIFSLYLISLDGKPPRQLTGARSPALDLAPAFSPDGRHLAYGTCSGTVRRACDVNVIELRAGYVAAGPARRIASPGLLVWSIGWSPDGSSLVYDTNARGPWEIWRASVDSGRGTGGTTGPERLEIPGEHSRGPVVAASRNRLVFERPFETRSVFELRSGGEPVPVLVSSTWDYNPAFSPDGQRIAFSSRRSGDVEEIWIARADGSGAYQLTHGPGRRQTLPEWSPDGREIAFESTAASSGSDIWVIPVDGGAPRRLTRGAGEENAPAWSRDGKRIYFLSDMDRGSVWPDAWQVSAAGGTPVRATEGGSGLSFHESADGKSLVYQRSDRYETAGSTPLSYETLGDTPLMEAPIDGGPPRQILPCVKALSFAVVDAGIYFSPCGGHRDRNPTSGFIETWPPGAEIPIQVLERSTGRVRTIGTVKAPFDAARLAVSPDGKRILVHRNTQQSDLMLIENFR